MENYICINGNKTELTATQVAELGFAAGSPEAELAKIETLVNAVKGGNARKYYNVHDIITVGGVDYEIIGFDHDKKMVMNGYDEYEADETAHTVTLWRKPLYTNVNITAGNWARGCAPPSPCRARN